MLESSTGEACGASGANVCGAGSCTPTSCEAQGKNCDSISDGCGAVLVCGTCCTGQTCGGDGPANVCSGVCATQHCAGDSPTCNPDTGACECTATSCGPLGVCENGGCVAAPGARFASTASDWPVPTGGSGESHGFWNIGGSPSGSSTWEFDSQQWTTMDLNGDDKPDLVATAHAVNQPDGGGQMLQVYGYPSAPHWKVYLNAP